MHFRNVLLGFSLLFVALPACFGQANDILTFQYMNMETLPDAINDWGQVAGHLGNNPDGKIGFVRQEDGSFQTFAYAMPGCDELSVSTWPNAINNRGTIAGQVYCGWNDLLPAFGFIRSADGNVTFVPDPDGNGLNITGINDLGFTVGIAGIHATFPQTCCRSRGFIRNPKGDIAYLDVAPNVTVVPYDVDSSGSIVGVYVEVDITTRQELKSGFIYRNGKYTLYRFGGDTGFFSINNTRHEVVGYVIRNEVRDRFVMKTNGQVKWITDQTAPYDAEGGFVAMNRHGDAVGFRYDWDMPPFISGFLALRAIK